MTREEEQDCAAAFHISNELGPFLQENLKAWLMEDVTRLGRASRLVTILRRDPDNTLKIRPTDLFRPDHLSFADISEAADERAEEDEEDRSHVKACSLCNAFIEVEAARLVLQCGLETDMDSVYGQVLQAPTDNDKWFGRTRDHRF